MLPPFSEFLLKKEYEWVQDHFKCQGDFNHFGFLCHRVKVVLDKIWPAMRDEATCVNGQLFHSIMSPLDHPRTFMLNLSETSLQVKTMHVWVFFESIPLTAVSNSLSSSFYSAP